MPTPTISTFEPCPVGDQVLQLISVDAVLQPDYNNPAVKVTRWKWLFESDKLSPETGEPLKQLEWTGTAYGDSRAALTKLLNWMVPGMTEDRAKTFNTDDLLLERFTAVIDHVKNEKGELRPRIAFMRPLAQAPAPTPAQSPSPSPSAPPPPKKLPPAWASRRQAVIDKLVAKGYSPEGSAETVDENGAPGDMKALKELEETIDAGGYDIADPFAENAPSAAAAASANAATTAVMAGAV